jgi:hypothetical protein
LALIELADRRLYLQDYYVKEWAESFVIFIVVDDAQAWHDHISAALDLRDRSIGRTDPLCAVGSPLITGFTIVVSSSPCARLLIEAAIQK